MKEPEFEGPDVLDTGSQCDTPDHSVVITAAGDRIKDLCTQLAQKDKDLILAAELGKALLEKNQELQHRYEQLNEEYMLKVEVSLLILVVDYTWVVKIINKFIKYVIINVFIKI